jgi:hypothetical protein
VFGWQIVDALTLRSVHPSRSRDFDPVLEIIDRVLQHFVEQPRLLHVRVVDGPRRTKALIWTNYF